MKKKIILTVCALVLAVAIGATLFVVISNKNNNKDDEPTRSLSEKLFTVETEKQFKSIEKEHKLQVESINGYYMLSDIEALGEKTEFALLFDEKNKLFQLSASCNIADKSDDVAKFKKKVNTTLNDFAKIFGAKAEDYYIYSSTEVYDMNDDEAYKKVLNGEAVIEFRLRNVTSYYSVVIQNNFKDKLTCIVQRYVNNPMYVDTPVNVEVVSGKGGE